MPTQHTNTKRLFVLFLAVAFSLAAVIVILSFALPTVAAPAVNPQSQDESGASASPAQTFSADLSGANEVPPLDTGASGEAVFVLDSDMSTLYYRVMVNDIMSVTTAHIHQGQPDENGPVVLWLYDSSGVNAPGGSLDPDNPVSGTLTLTPTQVAELMAGNYYVNVHTTDNPAGEVRGQIGTHMPDSHFNAFLRGDNEVPPVDTEASGVARLTLVTTDTLQYEVGVTDIMSITMAHIHVGWPDENGSVIHWLYDRTGTNAPGGNFPISGTITLDSQGLLDLLTGYYYVNVHTEANPGGEVRGQVEEGRPLAFRANLSGANEVPPLATAASGEAVLALNDMADTLYYRVMVSDIMSITMAHIHRGGSDVNGPVVHWLYDAAGTNGPGGEFDPGRPISGSLSLVITDVVDLMRGDYYINVHTTDNPAGEVRGQVERFDPPHRFMATLSGDNLVPPVDTDATGFTLFNLNNDLDELDYHLSVTDIMSVVQAHIHKGPAGENGPVVLFLYDRSGTNGPGGELSSDNPVSSTLPFGAENIVDLLTGYYYVNVHTEANPGGEIRGQIVVPQATLYLPVIARN